MTQHSAEELPQQLHKEIHIALTKSLIPAYEYLKLFETFDSLLKLDVTEYCNSYFGISNDKTEADAEMVEKEFNTKDVEKEINKHLTQSEKIKNLIPPSINIGLFMLKLDPIRNSLCEKHRNIAAKLQELFLNVIRAKCQQLSQLFTDVKKQLQQPCKKIEDLVEMKEYISSIPKTIANH